jgi:hypothetical protein
MLFELGTDALVTVTVWFRLGWVASVVQVAYE